MVEDAAADVFETTGSLVSTTPETAVMMRQALTEDRFPLLGKPHGDFRSRRLRNTEEELRLQDAELRRSLIESCARFGLVVAGYSGRDQSIMEALREGLAGRRGYPAGLFWLHRQGDPVRSAVRDLVEEARRLGIEAELVALETFDEMMGDLLALENDVPTAVREKVERRRVTVVSNAPIPSSAGTFPVLRMNALPVLEWPATCRLIECEIGGASEVRKAVEDAGVQLVVARRNVGVLAFGSDADVHKAFDGYGIKRLDVHTIDASRLRYETAELSLVYDALVRAVARDRPLVADTRRRMHRILVDTSRSDAPALANLKKVVGGVKGRLERTDLQWVEAINIRVEHRLGRLWLILMPAIAVPRPAGELLPDEGKDFIRERLSARYNRGANDLLAAWSELLIGDGSQLRAFGIGDGIDASFRLDGVTAFSRRKK